MEQSKSRSSADSRRRLRSPNAWLGKIMMRILESDRHLIAFMIAVSLLTSIGVVCSISS
jgi:hypothetical protein